jgi:hypothetical protein
MPTRKFEILCRKFVRGGTKWCKRLTEKINKVCQYDTYLLWVALKFFSSNLVLYSDPGSDFLPSQIQDAQLQPQKMFLSSQNYNQSSWFLPFPDTELKKAPDPGSGSATQSKRYNINNEFERYGTIPCDSAESSPPVAGNCTLLPLNAPVKRSTLKPNLVHLPCRSSSSWGSVTFWRKNCILQAIF